MHASQKTAHLFGVVCSHTKQSHIVHQTHRPLNLIHSYIAQSNMFHQPLLLSLAERSNQRRKTLRQNGLDATSIGSHIANFWSLYLENVLDGLF